VEPAKLSIAPLRLCELPHGASFEAKAPWEQTSADCDPKLGAPKAITATAHKLARLIYRMIKFGTEYVDKEWLRMNQNTDSSR
jgi:hypothetical protein